MAVENTATPTRAWAADTLESAFGRASLLRRILSVRLAAVALGVILLVVFAAVFADLIAPYDPLAQDTSDAFAAPSMDHWLGTDYLGRDTLSRLIYGSRVSLMVGVVSVGVAALIGLPVGLIAGYRRGFIGAVLMRIADGVLCFPALILALGIVAVLGSGIERVMLAIGLAVWPVYARLVRAQTLRVSAEEYVMAALALGASPGRIVARHVLPNAMAPVIVAATLGFAGAILAEAGLGFLGVGIVPPTPTWGSMLSSSFRYLYVAPWMSMVPGVAIFLLVLAFNFFGDALRDALDPRLRGK